MKLKIDYIALKMTEIAVYPIIVQMNTKDIQIGSVKVSFNNGKVINRTQEEWDVILEQVKIQFKKGDFLTKVKSGWT